MTHELRRLAERLAPTNATVSRIDADRAGLAILDLLDRLEKAEKDAQRYRWLKGDGKSMAVDSFKGLYRVIDRSVDLVVTEWLDSFDEAIDAAMEASK